MTAFTDRLKRLNFGDALIRRNPLLYRPARSRLAALQGQSLAARREWVNERLKKVLEAARRSPYGRRVGGGADLGSWPLLEKNSLRADPDARAASAWPCCAPTASRIPPTARRRSGSAPTAGGAW